MIEFLMIYQNVVLVYLAIFGTGKKTQSLISCSVLVKTMFLWIKTHKKFKI